MSNARELAGAIQKYFAILKQPHDDRTREFLGVCDSATLSLKGANYTYYYRGDGPKVLLIHGLHSNLGSMVDMAEILAGRYQVILFDAPAHGEAPGLLVNLPQLRSFAQALGAELGPLHAIIAHSLGAVWGLSAWGETLRAQTVVSISAPTSPRFLTEKFIQMNDLNPDVAAGLYQQLERRFGAAFWDEFSVPEIVKTLGVPGLVIHSEDDEMVPSSHAREIGQNWPGAETVILSGAEHFGSASLSQVMDMVANHLDQISPEPTERGRLAAKEGLI